MDFMQEMRSLQKSLERLEEEAFSRISRSHTLEQHLRTDPLRQLLPLP